MSNARTFQPDVIADVVTNPASPGVVALTTLNAPVLPDGCGAFVLSNRTFYRLNKASTDTPQGGAVGGLVAAMGGGNWVPVSGSQGSAEIVNFGDLQAALNGQSNFNSIVGTFVAQQQGAEWGINTSTGELTWRGPSAQKFLVNLSVSLYNTTTVIPTLIGLSVNGAAVSDALKSKATSPVATGANAVYQLGLTGILTLDQDDTVIALCAGSTSDVTMPFFQLTLVPLN